MSPREQLNYTEIRIATLVWQGRTNPEIAWVIGTSEQVIKNHLRNVFDKLGVWSRLELALYVAAHGGARWHQPDALVEAGSLGQVPRLVGAGVASVSKEGNDQQSAPAARKSKVLPRLISA